MFLGFSNSHKLYKFLDPTRRIYISRHVVFNEKEFPFKSNFLNKSENPQKSEIIIQYLPLHTSLNFGPTCSTDAAYPDATLIATSHNFDQLEMAKNVALEVNENEGSGTNDEHTLEENQEGTANDQMEQTEMHDELIIG